METSLAEYLSAAPVIIRKLDGQIVYWSEGAHRLYGFTWSEALGQRSHALLETQFPLPLGEIEESLRADGQWEGLLRHRRKDGTQVWTESRWRLKDDSHVVEVNVDVTHREVLTRELDHRIKNLIAMVEGIARMSLRPFRKSKEFKSFEARLGALATAHDLLLRHHWDHGEISEIVGRIISQLEVTECVKTKGPEIRLEPQAVMAYTMALHELATNAVKYGSLSVPEGRVELSWRPHKGTFERVYLVWREIGGPKVVPPSRSGFGMQLLKEVLTREFGNPAELRFEEQGLVCTIDGPMQKSPDLPGTD